MFVSWMGLGTFPLFMGVIPTETVGRAQAATAMGLVVMIGELTGGVFGPPIAGRLADSLRARRGALYPGRRWRSCAGTGRAVRASKPIPRVLARRQPADAAA